MELLKVEVEALESSMENRRKGMNSEKEAEKEKVVVLAGRLTEDLKRCALTCYFPYSCMVVGLLRSDLIDDCAGQEGILGTRSFRRREMRNLRNGRRGSCCFRGRRVMRRRNSLLRS